VSSAPSSSPADPAQPGPPIFQSTRCADQYDADRFGGSFGRELEALEVALYTDLIGTDARAVLDVGAGTGKLSLEWLRQGRQVTSADFSRQMLDVTRRKAAQDGLAARPVVADIHALCFRDAGFDCAASSRVLMHVGNWRQAIGELCRVSRSAVVLDFPPTISAAGADAWRKRRFPGRQGEFREAYQTFSVQEVVRELRRNGFTVTRVNRGFFLPIAWHRKLDRPAWSRRIERGLAVCGLVSLFGAPVTVRAVRR
jgi:ubiquinone/menaquinone biosynthesis C-methylase UbiE